jgi:hypothetical protein
MHRRQFTVPSPPRHKLVTHLVIKLRRSHREKIMLSAHHFWTEFKFMCVLIACAVMIGFLSASGAADGDRGAAQLGVEQPANTAK